jgi:phage shock protein PspC (stress-responsive transcriptional regulator)
MNKTVTINISGIIFHIEEDAYESLSKYLSTIKGYFSNTDGGNEILGDIEARIAELLQGKINASKQVILMMDVDYVKALMGKPEEFGAEISENETKATNDNPFVEEKVKRRLFRDPDERVIGGVCSGLANYFDIDTVWVRLVMFLLIFFGGISLWVYIVMWLIIPIAKTTAEKFAMRGEPANVNNIMRSFKEEADEVKTRINKYGKEIQNNRYATGFRQNAYSALRLFFNVLGRIIGFFIFLIGTLFLLAYLATLFGVSVMHSNADLAKWKSVIFDTSSDYALAITAFIIVCGIPIFLLIYTGIKLLFKISYSNRWLNRSIGLLWAVGIVLGFYVTINTVKQFNQSSTIKETSELHGMGDTLYIASNLALNSVKSFTFENNDELEGYFTHNHNGYYFGQNNNSLSLIGFAKLTVVENDADSIELVVTRSARGDSKKDANENAKRISYRYEQVGNRLIFDETFNASTGASFRVQEVDIKLKLPKGKVIYFDNSTENLLNEITNTSNTWEGDMINRRWKMTDKGLTCIDCKDLDHIDTKKSRKSKEQIKINSDHVIINGREINVKEGETEIEIDGHGIRIKTPEADEEKDESDNNPEAKKNGKEI